MKHWAIALSSSVAVLNAGAMAQDTSQVDTTTLQVGIYQNAPKEFVDAAAVNRFIGQQAETQYAIQPTNLLGYASQLYFVTAEDPNAVSLAAIDERLQELLAAPDSAYYQAEQQGLTLSDENLAAILKQALWDAFIYLPIVGLVIFAVWNYALRQEIKRRQQTENRLQMLTNNTPGVIFQYSLRSNGTESLLYASSRCVEVWGVAAESAIADVGQWWQRVHPNDAQQLRHALLRSARTLTPWTAEWRIQPAESEEKWLQVSAQPQAQDNGDIIWDGLIFDITERKSTEIALHQSNARFQQLTKNLPGILYGYRRSPDGSEGFTYLSFSVADIYGFTPEQALANTQLLWDSIYPDDREAVQRSIQQSYYTLQVWQAQYRVMLADGQMIWVQSIGRPEQQSNGDVVWDGLIIDITELKQAETALRHSEERLRLVTENMSDLVSLHDLDAQFTYVTPSSQTVLGYRPTELIGQHPQQFIHPADLELVCSEIYHPAHEGKSGQAIYRMRHKTAGYIWLETLSQPVLDASGAVTQVQTTSRNVSDRVQMEQQLKHDALHDSLTTLPNRDRLMRRLELALNRSKQDPDFQFAVLFLDLDNFKVVNDSLGHLVGDELLISVAQQLVQLIRDTDIAARLGGDEFVILLEEIAHIQDVVIIAERILATLRQPFSVAEREVIITTSIGIVSGDASYERAVDVLRDADLAMYRAKHSGRAQYAIFDPTMHFRVTQRLHLEQDLRKAVERSELLLYYQPIVDLETLQLVGFEALVRWQHPQRGLVSPSEFIAIAEETGLIKPIGQWVLSTACQQLADWQRQHPHKPLKMSVNLSVQQLQPALISQIEAVLAASQISPDALVLELTESMLAQNIEITQDLLEQVKQLGPRLSIDDFGTGYSSLSYLSHLPVDHLKIDRAFVSPGQTDIRNQVIAESIVALSDLLGLGGIAEGIETPGQLDWLKQLGCQEGQGYLFSAPVPAEVAAQLLYQTISV